MVGGKITNIRSRRESSDIAERLTQLIDNSEDPISLRGEIAGAMGITQSTLISAMLGEAPWTNLPYEALRVLARYLRMPGIVLYRELGLIQSSDFLPTEDDEEVIERLYAKLMFDPRFAAIAPNKQEWRKTPQAVKITLCVFYERLSAEVLSGGSLNERLGLTD